MLSHAGLAARSGKGSVRNGGKLVSSCLPSYPFFSSLPISTLNFLERANFTTKTREEKISFMKGLTTVLDKFSQGLRIRKILPSLVEEVGIVVQRLFKSC